MKNKRGNYIKFETNTKWWYRFIANPFSYLFLGKIIY